MLVVGANMGLNRMTKEHIGIAVALKIPIFVVVTKVDVAPESVYQDTISALSKILKNNCNLKPFLVNDLKDVKMLAENLSSRTICPIFSVSNVTGQGISFVKTFLSQIPKYDIEQEDEDHNIADSATSSITAAEFNIDSVHMVNNVGIVLGGTVKKGQIAVNSTYLMGPDKLGNFKPVTIKSIEENRVAVDSAGKGASICVAIKNTNKKDQVTKHNGMRKGMSLIELSKAHQVPKKGSTTNPLDALVIREFDAEVQIFHHSTTIKENYQAVVHCGGIRQSAKVVSIVTTAEKELLRSGDKGLVRFRFAYYPELLKPGARIMLREGRTMGIGYVASVYPGK